VVACIEQKVQLRFFIYTLYTLFRKNTAQYTIHSKHYTNLKQYTNTHDKTKVRDKITKTRS